MAPKAASDEIHDTSSGVIFPDVNGESSDLKSSKFGPVNPITMPKIKAVKLTESEIKVYECHKFFCRSNKNICSSFLSRLLTSLLCSH